jgi:asparagine synthase (glutamine-hydrolysing)
MCGITGILHFNKLPNAPQRVRAMTNAIAHRGPDAEGFYDEPAIALGHRRLSIIDLSGAANQPFIDRSGNYVMVFNGEIYNYLELKQQLSDYPFITSSDTEVLMAAFCKWGIDCVKLLEGMFALAVWDKRNETLWLARDRMGVKPLYFFRNDDAFAFSSENRSLLASSLITPSIDQQSMFEFLSLQSTGYPNAIISNIHQLQAGCCMKLTETASDTIRYWSLTDNRTTIDRDPVPIRKTLFDKMNEAVAKRMMSDVPMGAFLSGGIDSSAVVALMSLNSSEKINTFNLSFTEKEYDESGYAETIAKRFGTSHVKHLLRPEDFLDKVVAGLDAMDSPSADGINTFVLSGAIRAAGLKVALTGIGGDELFAGYPGFMRFYKLNNASAGYQLSYPLRKLASLLLNQSSSNRNKRLSELLAISDTSISNVYPIIRKIFSPDLIRQLVNTNVQQIGLEKMLKDELRSIEKFDLFSQYTIAEYMGYTQHTLLKDADQMSMAVGLEIREPFFDHKLVEYTLSIPDNIKYPQYPKQLMVEALEPLLPDEIVHRKKQGFVLPWEKWMRNELQSFCASQIKDLSQREFIKSEALLKYWNRFLKHDPSVRWMELWQFVVLGHWLNKNGINN